MSLRGQELQLLSLMAGGCMWLWTAVADAQTATPASQSETPATQPQRSPFHRFDYFETTLSFPAGAVLPGQGWNTVSGQGLIASCIKAEIKEEPGDSTLKTKFWEILDREDLVTALNVSAEGSYGSFSGNAKFAREIKLEKENRKILTVLEAIHYLMKVVPVDYEERMSKGHTPRIELSDSALEWLNEPNGDQKFIENCGNSYVSAVLYGASLEGLATYRMKMEEIKTAISASGSGSIGVGKGSASVSASTGSKLYTQDTRVEAIQHGKGLRNVTTGQALKALIDDPKLAQLDSKNAVPFRIEITPYVSLPGWPVDKRIGSMSPWLTRAYWGLKERLEDLGEVYQEAYEFPYRYYTPFQKSLAEVSQGARTLLAAAKCMEEFVDYCSRRSDCDIQLMLSRPQSGQRCPLSAQYSDPQDNLTTDEKAKVLALVVPRPVLDRAISTFQLSNSVELQDVSRDLEELQATLPSDDKSGQPYVPKESPPVAMYYELLAQAPMKRSLDRSKNWNTGRDDKDETKQVEMTCEQFDCQSATYKTLSDQSIKSVSNPHEFPISATYIYRDWVLRARLRPLVNSYCEVSRRHPMCIEVKPFADKLKPVLHNTDFPPELEPIRAEFRPRKRSVWSTPIAVPVPVPTPAPIPLPR